ncbi:MAG TPA: hypothetical protein VF104_08755 [Burkholderiales bacterium]
MASEFMTPHGKYQGIKEAAIPTAKEAAPPKQDYGGGKHASQKKHVNFKSKQISEKSYSKRR